MRVILEGSLRHFTASELLSLLAERKHTGTLDAKSGERRARLAFRDGRVAWAEAAGAADLTEIVSLLVGWRDGEFWFLDDVAVPDGVTPLALDVAPLVAAAETRLAEEQRLLKLFPDEQVALELERSAARAKARGGLAAAGAFLERAAALTPEPSRRSQRALAAAQTKFQAGALDDARALLDSAETGAPTDLERARVDLLRAQITFVATHGSDAPPLLLEAARRLSTLDPTQARETYLDALSAALFAGRLAGPGASALEIAQAARTAPAPPRPRRGPDVLLDAFRTLLADSYASLMPGSWPEPFGLVAIESLACGTPVIARPAGALPEIVRDGVDGFFADDVERLAAAVDRVGELDRAAIRASVVDRFSSARMADGYEAIYGGLIPPDRAAGERAARRVPAATNGDRATG